MTEAFSISREFDFVRLDGLRRATGRPPHEWDIYIVKELIDNALDADETLWSGDMTKSPRVNVRLEYTSISGQQSQQLFIQMSNRTEFPVEKINSIFATQWYTSRKAFAKGLTRGALGNALKTILGIPYALRNRVAGDWGPDLKPMSISCKGKEYLPRYIVDSTSQTLQFALDTQGNKRATGTTISVGLDYFAQEVPRVLADLQLLAQQYHMCNPHVEFHWSVEIGGQEWSKEYVADRNWSCKFRGIAPVQWYSPTSFHELLGALYRRENGENEKGRLGVEICCRWFSGFDVKKGEKSPTALVIHSFGQSALAKSELESGKATELYRLLCKNSPRFASEALGKIGTRDITAVLSETFPLDGTVIYESVTDHADDPNTPFVIEAAVARIKEGNRQIWTAVNFAPTYADPFSRRWLHAVAQPEPVLGLRGLLDAYGFREDSPLVLFLHLICPNVEHDEFSKTEINHLPFKQVLVDLLDRLLVGLRRAREEEEMRLEQAVFRALDEILAGVGESERFVFEQLVERLRVHLSRDPLLASWLQTPDAAGQLRSYVANYQSRNTVLTQHVARPAAGTVSIPVHPDHHFSVLAEQLSRDLLVQHHVNKILYAQVRELEPVIIENLWLSRMDMALLHNPQGLEGLQDAVVQCAVSCDLPILLLHNADESGNGLAQQFRVWLDEKGLEPNRILDLGLDGAKSDKNEQPSRLLEMMPSELAAWLATRLRVVGISIKSLPSSSDIRRDIRMQFDKLLEGHLWEGVSEEFEFPRLIEDLDRTVHFTKRMKEEELDNVIRNRLEHPLCQDSYLTILEQVVEDFYKRLMQDFGVEFQQHVQTHLKALQEDLD